MSEDEDELRAIERERLAAFVAKDIEKLQSLHADDFQLINPGGREVTKQEYINGVAGGMIDYRVWTPDSEIAVRRHGDTAVIRYTSRVEIVVQGELQPLQRFWHTDTYEKRDGRWQVVWSQATGIRS